jgi:uncharacterized protein with von Willebrand factor type A (vWA) domain
MIDAADLAGEQADSKRISAPLDREVDSVPPGLFAPRAIDDGSQCLLHDGFDVHAFERAAADYGKLGEAVAALRPRLITAVPLLRDLFWSFYKPGPSVAPIVPLTAAHQLNRQIVEQVMATTEWRQTRASGTIGDPLTAAMAALGVAYRAVEALSEATIAEANRLHELESGAAALFDQATALTDLADQAEGDRGRALFEQAEAARAEAERLQREAEQAAAALEAGMEEREEAVRRAARAGLGRTIGELDEAAAAIKVFGGYGGGGGHVPLTTRDRVALAQMVNGSRRLKQMMALAGRQQTVALEIQATKVPYPPTTVAGITFGNDISLLLPSELALLALPETRPLFYKGFAESSLMQWELVGREPQGQGPVIVAVDESGSMNGMLGPYSKSTWAGATLLAFLAIARLQGRDLVVFHFAEAGQLRIDHFPKGQAPYQEVIACADHFFNGGDTRFEPWMQQATDLVQAGLPRADVICLTDGLTRIDRGVLEAFNITRKAMEMRSFGVLIGTRQGEGELASCTDAVLTLDNLAEDLPILQTIFAI